MGADIGEYQAVSCENEFILTTSSGLQQTAARSAPIDTCSPTGRKFVPYHRSSPSLCHSRLPFIRNRCRIPVFYLACTHPLHSAAWRCGNFTVNFSFFLAPARVNKVTTAQCMHSKRIPLSSRASLGNGHARQGRRRCSDEAEE